LLTNFNREINEKLNNLKITIGIPAFNEEKNIAGIILKLKKIADFIIVCDDGSSDLTGEIAEKLDAVVINHQKNKGYGSAIKSIFLKAKEMDSDILVTFDADGQHQVEDINQIIEPIKNNKADIVIGSRFLKNDDNVPKYRKVGIKTITSLTNISTGSKITDAQSGFRAYSKKVLEMGISTEILIKASKQKFRITEVPIKISYEGETSTHHPVSHGASVVFSTIKFVAIENPLKFYGIPGIFFMGIGLYFILLTLQIFGQSRDVFTNYALIGIGGVILGTLFLMTSIILYTTVSVVRERK